MAKNSHPKFSAETIQFIVKASKQKYPLWLERNLTEFERVIRDPLKHLMSQVSSELKKEAPGYQFPIRALGRLKRSADNAIEQGPFRDWVGVSCSMPSKSRYDSLPNLYFHMDEDDVYAAGGLYSPSAKQTRHIRAWIDHDPSKFEALFEDPNFKKYYPDFGDEKVLKTKPRDYPLDHPHFKWLRLSAWYVWKKFSLKEFYSSEFPSLLADRFRQVLKLNAVLDYVTAVMPPATALHTVDKMEPRKMDW